MIRHCILRYSSAFFLFLLLASIPFWNDDFYTGLCSRIVILAIAAVSLNLVLGFGGMISFGHAAFLGIGAYAVGIPVYYGFDSGWLHLFIAVVGSAFYALVTGALVLRSSGGHFIVMTMSVAQMLFFFAASLEIYGGSNGMIIDTHSSFAPLGSLENDVVLYYTALSILLLVIFLTYHLVNSHFGLVLRGAHANERRMQFLGYNSYLYRLIAYVISGIMCSISGVLLGNFSYFISPDMLNWTHSADLVFMVVLGGTGTLFGPIIGVILFIVSEHILSSIFIHWQLVFGLALAIIVLFARNAPGSFLSGKRSGNE